MIARFDSMPAGGADPASRLRLRQGTPEDYNALAHWHYRAGRPATCVRVLAMDDPAEPSAPVAVVVVSMPTLEGRWREAAWPGRYSSGDKRADAARLNAEVRTVSRLVVDPRWRGLGVGRRLVRAYLDSPLTPATEAVAAMGRYCPVFRAAGMREYRLGPDRRDARLGDALVAAGAKAWELCDRARAADLAADPFLRRELRLWADASRITRDLLVGPMDELARSAGARLLSRRCAYAHRSGDAA